MWTNYFKICVERLHTDGGGEYNNAKVGQHTPALPDTSPHDPWAERINRTPTRPLRVTYEEAGLSAKFWEFATEHLRYI